MISIEAAAAFDIVSLRRSRLNERHSTKNARMLRVSGPQQIRRNLVKNRLQLLIVLMALVPTLAACSASCDCPRPGPTSTTVITPPGHNMVVEPAD
jgi:hypothetical protein